MEDFLLFNDQLSDDEKIIRDVVRQFVDEDVIEQAGDAFEQGIFPEKWAGKSAELGLFGLTLPEKYDCAGAGYVAYGLACQELERGDGGLRSFITAQSSLCMYPIFKYGSEEQKDKYLPKMAVGEVIGCFGLTESESGSDPAGMKTTAKKVEGGWILNGSKKWITNATISDIAIVWANTEEGIRGFIVDKDTKGLQRKEIKNKMSLRSSVIGELALEDCFVSENSLLPGTSIGLAAPQDTLAHSRFGIAWGAIGAAMACYETALQYTKDRKQFGKPIASFQLVQRDLAYMFTEIVKAQALNLQIGRLREAGKDTYQMISMAKMNSCREALKIARLARNLLGGNGISLEFPVIRHMANLESVLTYEGTDNMHQLVLGQHITGIDALS
ncbi:MAG: acyl-CoA dehydrogenase [Proteobacteria bacterium]|nr:acyl-CoA dehydrogenase [Pseudomonadota bacterium]